MLGKSQALWLESAQASRRLFHWPTRFRSDAAARHQSGDIKIRIESTRTAILGTARTTSPPKPSFGCFPVIPYTCVRRCRAQTAGGRYGVSDQPNTEVLEDEAMKVRYDRQSDTLTLLFKEGVTIAESDEEKPGLVLDYDERGDVVSIEVLDASTRVTEARSIDFQTT